MSEECAGNLDNDSHTDDDFVHFLLLMLVKDDDSKID